jgi:hypothetical protein
LRYLRRFVFGVITLLVMGAGAAEADSILTTSALLREGREFKCIVVNAGTRDAVVRFQMIDIGGNVDGGQTTASTIAPGQIAGGGIGSTVGSGLLYCRFTVEAGNKAALRASACVLDADAADRCVVSSDAR